MSTLGRRRMLAGLALLPVFASQGTLAQAPGAPGPSGSIAPPPLPMVYSRRLERTLVDDARIVVERRFAIRFTPAATGFMVDGEQIGVAVDMPDHLEALARLERERVETGIFPLELDQRGWIRSGLSADAVPEIDEALRYVEATLASIERSADEQQRLRDFIAAIHEAGSTIISSLPVDLFAPADSDRSDQRSIALPAGGQGLVQTHFSARRDPATGLMQTARREVITTIAQDQRRTTELFTLV